MLDMLLFAHDAETDNEDAEEFSAYSLNTLPTKYKSEEVTLYGVHDDSKYIDVDFSDGVYISKAYADKFLLKPGDRSHSKKNMRMTSILLKSAEFMIIMVVFVFSCHRRN